MNLNLLGFDRNFDGVLIDTNLLLLLLVGAYDQSLIAKFKKTLRYNIEDYEKLATIVVRYNNVIYTTPNILTEVTNLTDNEVINKGQGFFIFLLNFIENFVEIVNTSLTISENNSIAFTKMGLADASIVNIATNKILVITDDLDLFGFLSSQQKPVINYNYLKYYN